MSRTSMPWTWTLKSETWDRIGGTRFKVDDGSSSGASFSSSRSFANGYLEITANNSYKLGIDLHPKNPAPGLDCY